MKHCEYCEGLTEAKFILKTKNSDEVYACADHAIVYDPSKHKMEPWEVIEIKRHLTLVKDEQERN